MVIKEIALPDNFVWFCVVYTVNTVYFKDWSRFAAKFSL